MSVPSWLTQFSVVLYGVAGSFVPFVCTRVDRRSEVVSLVACHETRPHRFAADDDSESFDVTYHASELLRFQFPDALPPIGVGDFVVARVGVTLEFMYAAVIDVLPNEGASGYVEVEYRAALDADDEASALVSRLDVVVLASCDAMNFLADVERSGNLSLAINTAPGWSLRDFESTDRALRTLVREIESKATDFAVISGHDANGFDIEFDRTNDLFATRITEFEFLPLEEVSLMYNDSFATASQPRILYKLHNWGATLFVVPLFKQQGSLDNTDVRAAWFVAARDGHQARRDAILVDVLRKVNEERRKHALFVIARSVARVADVRGRTRDSAELLAHLLLGIEAGEGAPKLCAREGWNWSTYSAWLTLVYDVHWQLRIDLLPTEQYVIDSFVDDLIDDVGRPERQLPSDVYIPYIEKYYSSFGDLLTDPSRRSLTQKVTNPNASWRGAKAFVENEIFVETGQRVNVNLSTMYRRAAPFRWDSNEGLSHRHVVLHVRPGVPARGDIGKNEDSHYANAQTRYVREECGNQLPRDNAQLTIRPSALFSRDCKKKVHLRNNPVDSRRSEWHIVKRDSAGVVQPTQPTLPSISSDQSKHDTVVSHMFLRLDRADNSDGGTPYGVLSHGKYARSPALHLAELLLLVESSPSLLFDKSGKLFEEIVLLSDRGPHENMTHISVIILHRYLMHILGFKRITLAAYASSSRNPVETVHAQTNKALGSTEIGVHATADDDVRAVARRVMSATFGGVRIKNALLLDGVADALVPSELLALCRGFMSKHTPEQKAAANRLLPLQVPVLARVFALRRTLGIVSDCPPMTFGELLSQSSPSCSTVFRSEYMLVLTAAGLAKDVVHVPIPFAALGGRFSSQSDHYLSYADHLKLRNTGIDVECEDGSVVSFEAASKTPDLFLPSALLKAYFKRVNEDALFDQAGVARLARFTILDPERVKSELQHLLTVRNHAREGGKKAAMTRKRNLAIANE